MLNEDLEKTIKTAIEIKKLNNLDFVTIWKTGELYGFSFDNRPIGYETTEYTVKRKVIGVY